MQAPGGAILNWWKWFERNAPAIRRRMIQRLLNAILGRCFGSVRNTVAERKRDERRGEWQTVGACTLLNNFNLLRPHEPLSDTHFNQWLTKETFGFKTRRERKRERMREQSRNTKQLVVNHEKFRETKGSNACASCVEKLSVEAIETFFAYLKIYSLRVFDLNIHVLLAWRWKARHCCASWVRRWHLTVWEKLRKAQNQLDSDRWRVEKEMCRVVAF